MQKELPPPSYDNPSMYPAVTGQPQAGGYPTAPGGHHTVVVPGGTNTVIVQQPVTRPATYMWLSCLVYWCCNCIAGAIAFALSMASSSAADDNRMEEARSYGKASLWTSVIGLVLGIITIIVIIVLYVTTWKTVVEENCTYVYGYKRCY